MKPYMYRAAVLIVSFILGAASAPRSLAAQNTPANAVDVLNAAAFLQAGQRGGGGRGAAPAAQNNNAAWWTNSAVIQRLGLSDDQKNRINRTFENYRKRLETNSSALEKEEEQLSRLMAAETVDRFAILTQIDRVASARSEVERASAAMALEMREVLTREQWQQLQTPSAQPPAPGTRIRVGGNVASGNLISQSPAVYPESAKEKKIQGSVVLEVEVSRDGVVENLRVITGHPELTSSALEAVKQWRYKPVLLNGEPMPFISTVTVNFSLAGEATGPTPAAVAPGQRRGGLQ